MDDKWINPYPAESDHYIWTYLVKVLATARQPCLLQMYPYLHVPSDRNENLCSMSVNIILHITTNIMDGKNVYKTLDVCPNGQTLQKLCDAPIFGEADKKLKFILKT